MNTCLWGGKYNPIIPCLKQVPRWWSRDKFSQDTATETVNGYLDFFEPDFLVEADPGLSKGLGFDEERVLPLSAILTVEGDRERKGQGLSVISLYRHLYHEEFQFARRHEHNIVDVAAKKKSFRGLSACFVWGLSHRA